MPATQPSKELRALCHEHHAEMRLNQSLLNSEENGNTNELDMVPNVRCPHDGTPMYLAEVDPDKKGFRLWICPQCDGRRTNEEGLIGLASQEIQDVSGKNAA